MNPQIFTWLDLFDLNIWAILIPVIGAASLTMVSGLLIIIPRRTQMISILKTLGINGFTTREVFLWFFVFLIGKRMLWGNAIGITSRVLQSRLGLFKPDPETCCISTVPASTNV